MSHVFYDNNKVNDLDYLKKRSVVFKRSGCDLEVGARQVGERLIDKAGKDLLQKPGCDLGPKGVQEVSHIEQLRVSEATETLRVPRCTNDRQELLWYIFRKERRQGN